jgi:hypothetical protein
MTANRQWAEPTSIVLEELPESPESTFLHKVEVLRASRGPPIFYCLWSLELRIKIESSNSDDLLEDALSPKMKRNPRACMNDL